MIQGLVLGKFMPLHNGHIGLIDFAKSKCDHLTILLCYTENERIHGTIRFNWLQKLFASDRSVTVVRYQYDEAALPNTSVSSEEVSEIWARILKQDFPFIDIIFSSEDYGAFVAKFMNIRFEVFDKQRISHSFSASEIRKEPFKNWGNMPEIVRPYFVKKIALLGSESTGKSVLTKRLSGYFNTVFVPEMAREIIMHTTECKPEHLKLIAKIHAESIISTLPEANKLLFIDTDINITKSYSRFLFSQELELEEWIMNANKMDLYFFLETDCDFVQDGTRLDVQERNRLNEYHKKLLADENISYVKINGSWDDRFHKMISVIEQKYFGVI